MASDDGGTSWARQLLVGVGALVAVALVIGGVVSVVALGAARVTGISSSRSSASATPSLDMPSGDPTVSLDPYPAPTVTPRASTSGSASPSASPKPTRKPRSITLQASPSQVSANQRISLTGVYRGGAGAQLQVQRYEGGWVDFPVTAPVNGDLFSTYVTTGRTGLNKFRVVDQRNGRASNAVRVRVG